MARTIISMKVQLMMMALLLLITSCNHRSVEFEPVVGDLLFQDIDCGPVCEAIETVTKGYRNADLSHVGIADTLNGEVVVLEAISRGVVYTPLNEFLLRSADSSGHPKVLVGRLTEKYREAIPNVLQNARAKIGYPYDNIFAMNDSLYYCSELVFEAYTMQSVHLFSLAPMTFKAKDNNEFFPSWVEYYNELNQPIPEGLLGINPGLISRSNKIDIVHVYGYPEGFTPDTIQN